jgi:hypothetical protein
MAAILLAAAAGFGPLTASATLVPPGPAGYRLRAPAPTRTLTSRAAHPRTPARINTTAPSAVGTGVSPNFAVSPPGRDAFETTTVASDSAFHRTVYVSAEDQSTGAIAGFTSGDAGGTWSPSPLPSPTTGPRAFLALPSAGFDSASNIYQSYLGGAVNGTSVATQLLVARSVDRGHTWASPTVVEGSNIPDSPQLAVDTTGGTHKNRVYVVYNTNPVSPRPGYPSQPLFLAHSDDGIAWTRTQVADTGSDRQPYPAIGPNGEVYRVWTDYCGSRASNPTPLDCVGTPRPVLLRIARSEDGGDGFFPNALFAELGRSNFPYAMPNYSNDCGGFGPIPIEPSPSVATDRSGGPYAGTLYVAYTNRDTNSHVYVVRSLDKGRTWQGSMQLDTGNLNTDAWGPALAVDQSNGVVTVAWYDRRDDPKNKLYRVYYSQSSDGGQTFLPKQVAVSDRQADPTVDCLATGAYMQMRSADGIAQPFWTDTDSGSIRSALISERANAPVTQVFGTPYAVPPPISPRGIVTGDFNGDGKPDLAVIAGNAISIYLGKGDGTFTAGQTIPLDSGGTPWAIVNADFDGDGKQDLAVTGQRCVPTCSSSVWFLHGGGDGTFQVTTVKAVGGLWSAGNIAVGDFNNDGRPDLVFDGDSAASPPIAMTIMLNTSTLGTIGFNGPVALAALGAYPVVSDFNGDGNMDIAYSHTDGWSNSYVGILLGTGKGTFQAPRTYSTFPPTTALATADLNLDGKPDLVVSTNRKFMIMLGNGDGTFTTHLESWNFPAYLQAFSGGPLVVRDVTGDGVPDIVADCPTQTSGAICAMVGMGDGTFGSPIISTFGNNPYGGAFGIVVGDFNSDRKPDLVVSSEVYNPLITVLPHIVGRLSGSSRVSFGAVPMGQTLTRNAVVTNSGSDFLQLSLLSTESPDFSIVDDPCSGATLAAGASCTVTIRFTPVTLQAETANLIAIGDSRGTTVTIPLDGMGTRGIAPPGLSGPFRPRTAPGSIPLIPLGSSARWQSFRFPARAR